MRTSMAGARQVGRAGALHTRRLRCFSSGSSVLQLGCLFDLLLNYLVYIRGFVPKGDRVLGYNIIVVSKRY